MYPKLESFFEYNDMSFEECISNNKGDVGEKVCHKGAVFDEEFLTTDSFLQNSYYLEYVALHKK